MADFRQINTQAELEALFGKTNFLEDHRFDGMKIESPDEDGQFIWVPECSYMGSLMSTDIENNGEDALFVQTLVQMFNSGKIKVVE